MPTFLVIGAMKAGTTSLYHYLRAHPDVFMPLVKELDFFVEHANWRRGLAWYARQFEGAEGVTAVGEASTAYTKFPTVAGVPERIAAHLPDIRLIYVIRDPIDRMRSHYRHRLAAGSERAPLGRAVRRTPVYLNCSRYALQLERYLEHFPRERILVVTSEDLLHARASTMQRVYGFLEVDESFVPGVIEQEFYRTEDRATFSPAAWGVRRTLKRYLPGAKRAKELVDTVAPKVLSGMLGRSDRERPAPEAALDDRLRSELVALLKDDVGRLRRYMPEGFDGWGIA